MRQHDDGSSSYIIKCYRGKKKKSKLYCTIYYNICLPFCVSAAVQRRRYIIRLNESEPAICHTVHAGKTLNNNNNNNTNTFWFTGCLDFVVAGPKFR